LLGGLALVGMSIYITHKLVQRRRLFRESQRLRIRTVDPVECGVPAGTIGGAENGK
jgi:flagellar biogenesis protein FliO